MVDLSDHSFPTPSPRVADADREVVVTRLQEAAADGRLDLSELEERLDAVYSARTRADLDALTADLPIVHAPNIPDLQLKTKSGSLRKNGYWQVPSRISAECVSGSIKLDFTEAECFHREVIVEVSAKSGSVVFVVPHGWAVDLDHASATSGSVVNKIHERPRSGVPLLRVGGTVTSGVIKARYPRRSFRVWLADLLSRISSK
ncbi:MAG: DUF1707 domain-containing protein [Spirochaetales bacterium]|nr:DUF1707 domain-containing protein [Spirochaetales bacterium]